MDMFLITLYTYSYFYEHTHIPYLYWHLQKSETKPKNVKIDEVTIDISSSIDTHLPLKDNIVKSYNTSRKM